MWHGRLDNRGDLVRQLGDSVVGPSSDGSLLVAAYDRWGIAGLGRAIGDWSAVISDPRRRAIVLASDFSGVRSLYYHRRGNDVLWSRSLEALLGHVDASALDEQYVAGYLTVGGYPGRTPYAGVHAVLPGYALRVTRAGATASAFWQPPTSEGVRCDDEREYEEQFRSLFRAAVSSRLQAPGPVVAELSGGLDSSSVVCMAVDLIRRGDVSASDLTAISYVHQGSRDIPFIGKVEEHCDLRSVRLSVDDIPLFVESDIHGALPHSRSRLQQSAAALARDAGATTFLTGQAGDQVTGNWLDDSLQIARAIRRGRFVQASRDALAWSRAGGVPAVWILSRASRASLPYFDCATSLYQVEGMTSAGDTSLRVPFLERAGLSEPDAVFSNEWMAVSPWRRPHVRALTMTRELRLLEAPEPMDGLDYGHPFMHRPLVEFLLSIPADVVCQPGEPRRLMRRALSEMWPAALRGRRSKSLFSSSYLQAFRPLAVKLLQERRWRVVERGWIDRESLASRLERLSHGLECNQQQLRQILLLEYWLRNRESASRNSAISQAS
jgi:asparagine synthase (glutamine-hydrolysing)